MTVGVWDWIWNKLQRLNIWEQNLICGIVAEGLYTGIKDFCGHPTALEQCLPPLDRRINLIHHVCQPEHQTSHARFSLLCILAVFLVKSKHFMTHIMSTMILLYSPYWIKITEGRWKRGRQVWYKWEDNIKRWKNTLLECTGRTRDSKCLRFIATKLHRGNQTRFICIAER